MKKPGHIAESVKGARKAQNLTLEALSEKSGVSVATISRLERGYETVYSNVVAVLNALGLTLSGE